jgi:hypothetical protein
MRDASSMSKAPHRGKAQAPQGVSSRRIRKLLGRRNREESVISTIWIWLNSTPDVAIQKRKSRFSGVALEHESLSFWDLALKALAYPGRLDQGHTTACLRGPERQHLAFH